MDNNTITPNEPVIPTPTPAPGPTMPQPEQQPPVGQAVVSNPGMPALPADNSAKRSALIETVVLIVVCIIAAVAIVFAVIFFIQKDEAETNVQGKIDAEVAIAVEAQKTIDESNFAEREKLPNSEFVGPSDYGSLSFMYPKTWSIYVAKDASKGGDFEAYFNPIQVNTTSENTINSLRVYIYDRPIDQVRTNYDALVRSGKLTSSVYTVGDITGTKYEGAFNNNITGIALMIKINDKTAVIRTDAEIFRKDFEALITTIRKN